VGVKEVQLGAKLAARTEHGVAALQGDPGCKRLS
jgi:hypothetical protein